MAILTHLTSTKSEMVQALNRWWDAARGAKDTPDRAQLDPADIKALLPFILLSEVEADPFRVRYRLVGTRAVNKVGFDYTGGYLDALWPAADVAPWVEAYRMAFESRALLLGAATDRLVAGGTFTYEFGIFPLSRGGHAVEQFIAVEDYFGSELQSAEWLRSRGMLPGAAYLHG